MSAHDRKNNTFRVDRVQGERSDWYNRATMTSLPVLDEPSRLVADLASLIRGRVLLDRHSRQLYATDGSIYQVEPLAVAIPADVEDLHRIATWCGRKRVPLLPRGGGTSLAGQCTARALVVDYSGNCRRVLSHDAASRTVHVEPGITIDDLNRWLEEHGTGTFFAPDPATSAQAAIGGCVGNNAAGARSIRYGRTSENLAALDVALTTGDRLWLERGAGRHNAVALRLARQVAQVVRDHADLIRSRFPRTLRRNAGYALDLVLKQIDNGVSDEDLDLTGLLCGSEGTLAVTLGARLRLHPVPRSRGLAICSFATVEQAIAAVPACVASGASAVELLDDVVLDVARGNNECRRYLRLVPRVDGNEPCGVLYVEYQETGPIDQVQERFAGLRRALPGVAIETYVDKPSLDELWALRKAGEPLLHGLPGHRKPVTAVEDNAIPLENLARFVAEFKKIVQRHGTRAAYYAHASVGVLHVRPLIDLHDPQDRQRLNAIAVEVADLARDCGGVMSGEHGDGRIRGPLLERYFGREIMDAFRRIKSIFDPAGVLNPGNIVQPGPVESITRNLRVTPGDRPIALPDVDTYFDYADQENFQSAVEMCNGAGVCRKTAGGTMCPSYRATLDERHSTRGRGNALRLAISGQVRDLLGQAAWDDPGTMQTLALCLSCKACKSECPSNVDIARLKAEYTAQRYRESGEIPLQARVFGHVRTLNRLGSLAPSLANWINSLPPVRAMLNEVLGLAPQRSMPRFERSLYRWFASRPPVGDDRLQVVLYADCFVTYNEPRIGRAAVELLERLGYRVAMPRVGCCGRSMISTGLLDDAIRSADAVLSRLRPFLEDERTRAILVCEPSCLAAMKDDWLQLRLKTPMELRRKLAERAMLVEGFVDRFWDRHPNELSKNIEINHDVLLHGHCHQKALWGDQTSANILRRLIGSRLTVLPTGCCGMAGSFGFTMDRYEVSMKVGELSLLPIVRQAAPDAVVLAPGTSCRHQIKDGAGREALHPIEFIARILAGASPG